MNDAKTKPKVVFVCIGNASGSQMAQAFAEAFAKGKVEVYRSDSEILRDVP
jgi:protein-tyrosine-phosphatase